MPERTLNEQHDRSPNEPLLSIICPQDRNRLNLDRTGIHVLSLGRTYDRTLTEARQTTERTPNDTIEDRLDRIPLWILLSLMIAGTITTFLLASIVFTG